MFPSDKTKNKHKSNDLRLHELPMYAMLFGMLFAYVHVQLCRGQTGMRGWDEEIS
jgi:hypothetical protein